MPDKHPESKVSTDDAWDEGKGRYRGLRAGHIGTIAIEGESILVKPDVAAKQMEVPRGTLAFPRDQVLEDDSRHKIDLHGAETLRFRHRLGS